MGIERVLGETAGGKPQADRNLLNIMIESILMVFVIGGIVDALHLGKPHERRPVPIPAQRPQPGRQRRF